VSQPRPAPRSLAATLRRVPPLLYIALIALSSVFVARDLYDQHVATDAAAANKIALDETTRDSIGGINYGITMYKWSPSMSPLGVGDPLTTRNSYSLEIAPRGSSCAHGAVQRVQIELQSPALTFEPVRPVSIDMAALQQYYCAVTPAAAAPPAYHWDVLPKQDGEHVLAVHVVGLDKNGVEVSSNPTLEMPFVVSDNPFTLAGVLGTLGTIGGVIGALFALNDRIFGQERANASQSGSTPPAAS
jgi:hypothetical protein